MSELESFVLGYLEALGGLTEPAGHGVYEVLLPESVAQTWGRPAYQTIAFRDVGRPDVIRLGYNHPWVEQMAAEVRQQPALARLYLQQARLDKSGLDELAAKHWAVVNGRVLPQKRATLARMRATYLRFNFKATIISDEKEEHLVAVLMNASTGYRVEEAQHIEAQANATEPDLLLLSLPDLPLHWRPEVQDPLSLPALEGLLDRAQTATQAILQDKLTALRKRLHRFRTQDEERLTDYYDGLKRDLQQRLRNAAPERQTGLEEKIRAVELERAHKMADLDERYTVRIVLTLLNVLVIQQPKLALPMVIENRTTQATAYAVWDPVLHRLELLPCAVCGQPMARLVLCHNGHLAHENCLAPACVDCKRLFCQLCQAELGECAVCHRPLCRHSRISCPTCQRGTCQAHQGLCHANDGQPVDLTASPTTPDIIVNHSSAAPPPESPTRTVRSAQKKPDPKAAKARPTPKVVKAAQIKVVVEEAGVIATALDARDHRLAQRTWRLEPEKGVVRHCYCQKGTACQAHGYILRPPVATYITHWLLREIHAFGAEYHTRTIAFYRFSPYVHEIFPMPKFETFGLWQDEATLQRAREGFDALPATD